MSRRSTFTPLGAPIFLAAFTTEEIIVIALTLGFLIISLGIHEAAHAYVAWRRGDSTAKDLGRMTLDPIPHIDPIMTLLVPIVIVIGSQGTMMFGGAKPVPVNYYRLRSPLRDMMLVALAGPISNFLLAIFFMVIWKVLRYEFDMDRTTIAMQVMEKTVLWNLLLAAFNMIPIPPLDGSRVMAFILPQSLREGYVSLERFGMVIVLGLWFLGIFRLILFPVMGYLHTVVDFLTGGTWA